MAGERVSSTLLLGGEGGSEAEFPCCSLVTLVGRVGGNDYATSKSGLSAGMQMEAWW